MSLKPALVLLHGALGSRAQLQPLKQVLQNDFDVHALDFEGHGINPLPQRAFRIEHFAENLLTFIDKLELAPTNIFGYSMGGFVALYLAMRRPEMVNRIFTLATKLDWNPQSAAHEAAMLDPAAVESKFPDYAASLQRAHSADWKQVMQRTAEMMQHLGTQHPLEANAFLQLPHRVRFAVGDKDRMVTLEETIQWYRKLKNAELQVFPHTQHPMERVDVHFLSSSLKEFFLYDR